MNFLLKNNINKKSSNIVENDFARHEMMLRRQVLVLFDEGVDKTATMKENRSILARMGNAALLHYQNIHANGCRWNHDGFQDTSRDQISWFDRNSPKSSTCRSAVTIYHHVSFSTGTFVSGLQTPLVLLLTKRSWGDVWSHSSCLCLICACMLPCRMCNFTTCKWEWGRGNTYK